MARSFSRQGRKRRFRASRRAAWRQNTWIFHHWAEARVSDGALTCPVLFGNVQFFFPILRSEDYGPPDAFSPNPGTTNVDAPGERITTVRSFGALNMWSRMDNSVDPVRHPMRLVAGIFRLDEARVWDVGAQFSSMFFEEGMQRDERLLQFFEPELKIGADRVAADAIVLTRARIEFDLQIPMRLETGEGLWLVVEAMDCQDAESNVNYDLPWEAAGHARTLIRI